MYTGGKCVIRTALCLLFEVKNEIKELDLPYSYLAPYHRGCISLVSSRRTIQLVSPRSQSAAHLAGLPGKYWAWLKMCRRCKHCGPCTPFKWPLWLVGFWIHVWFSSANLTLSLNGNLLYPQTWMFALLTLLWLWKWEADLRRRWPCFRTPSLVVVPRDKPITVCAVTGPQDRSQGLSPVLTESFSCWSFWLTCK